MSLLICAFLWLCLLPVSAADTVSENAAPPTPPRLNVLFILSDDMRPELGCYGGAAITPNLDKLAARGVRFQRAYCQYPLCNPTRTSLLTGRYPTTSGVLDNTVHFRDAHPDWVTLPQHFMKNGYRTFRIGKVFHGGNDDTESWSEGSENKPGVKRPEKKPFDREAYRKTSDCIVTLEGDGEGHSDFKIADQTIATLQRMKREGTPFFMTCGFNKPHSPPTAPRKYFPLFPLERVKLPPDFADKIEVPAGFPANCIPENSDLFIQRLASEQEAREVKAAYLASVSWVDSNAGRVLDELDRLGLTENTVVVFWGDHGYHLGEKGKWSKHGSLFDVGLRVPFIIAAPGQAGNRQPCLRTVEVLSLYPTLAELCGLPAPVGIDGVSIASLLRNPQAEWTRPALAVAGKISSYHRAVRNERWLYAEYDNGTGGAMLIDELNDPHELKNLADDPAFAETRREMQNLLARLPGLEQTSR